MGPDIPKGLTPEAKRERLRFMKAVESLTTKTGKIALSILVWGQDPKKRTPLARKRRQIRAELRRRGHHALFSEEIAGSAGQFSEKTKEFAQALAAHLIIILVEESPGAMAEAHDFCEHPDIAPKVFVLIPQSYKKG